MAGAVISTTSQGVVKVVKVVKMVKTPASVCGIFLHRAMREGDPCRVLIKRGVLI
jgi:hypothetical protein